MSEFFNKSADKPVNKLANEPSNELNEPEYFQDEFDIFGKDVASVAKGINNKEVSLPDADEINANGINAAKGILSLEKDVLQNKVDPIESSVEIFNDYNFIPRTKRELSDIKSIIYCQDKVDSIDNNTGSNSNNLRNKTKINLANILGYQITSSSLDPNTAVKAVIGRYKEYAENAKKEAYFMGELLEQVKDDSGVANMSKVGTSLKYSNDVKRAFADVIWHSDTEDFYLADKARQTDDAAVWGAELTNQNKPDVYNANQYKLSSDYIRKRAEELINVDSKLPLDFNFVGRLNEFIGREEMRYGFWVAQLKSAEEYSPTKITAGMLLREIGVYDDDFIIRE